MITWVPPRAPDLWGHPSWERPSCSRAMRVASPLERHPYKSYLFQWLFTCVTPERVIHTTRMDSHDLGFSLTDNWCVVWDPPLVAQLCCSSHRCLTSLHCRGHISTSWWSMSDHSLVPWRTCLARHWPMPHVEPTLRGPIIISGQTTPEDWSVHKPSLEL